MQVVFFTGMILLINYILFLNFSFGSHCTQRFISVHAFAKVSVARSDRAVNHMTSHVIRVPSISLSKFHLSASREKENEADEPEWISEKFGKECVIIPIAIDKIYLLQRKLTDLSWQNDVGYFIKSAGERSKFDVYLYGKTKEEAEKVGRLLKEWFEERTGGSKPKPLHTFEGFVPAQPEEGDIPASHVLFKVLKDKESELRKIEENFECKIHYKRFVYRKGFTVHSNDATKRDEAEVALKKVVDGALEELRSADVLIFDCPDEFSMADVLSKCEKEFEENVYFGTSRKEGKIYVTVYADNKETAAKFQAYVLDTFQNKTEEAKNQFKKIVNVDKYTRSFKDHINQNFKRQLERDYHSNVKIHFHESENDRKKLQCIVTGDNAEEVQKVADQIAMMKHSFRPLPKVLKEPLNVDSSNIN